jgi:uncharacterized membrane protein
MYDRQSQANTSSHIHLHGYHLPKRLEHAFDIIFINPDPMILDLEFVKTVISLRCKIFQQCRLGAGISQHSTAGLIAIGPISLVSGQEHGCIGRVYLEYDSPSQRTI